MNTEDNIQIEDIPLPNEITCQIFDYLTDDEMITSFTVCKRWKRLLIKLHEKRLMNPNHIAHDMYTQKIYHDAITNAEQDRIRKNYLIDSLKKPKLVVDSEYDLFVFIESTEYDDYNIDEIDPIECC